jgi:hypothetical protein
MAPGKDELPVKGPGAEFVFTCSHSAFCRLAVGLPILLGHLPMRRRLGRYGVRIRVQAVHLQVHLRRCAPALGASRIHGVLFRSLQGQLSPSTLSEFPTSAFNLPFTTHHGIWSTHLWRYFLNYCSQFRYVLQKSLFPHKTSELTP